jgi:hypothetical protein
LNLFVADFKVLPLEDHWHWFNQLNFESEMWVVRPSYETRKSRVSLLPAGRLRSPKPYSMYRLLASTVRPLCLPL